MGAAQGPAGNDEFSTKAEIRLHDALAEKGHRMIITSAVIASSVLITLVIIVCIWKDQHQRFHWDAIQKSRSVKKIHHRRKILPECLYETHTSKRSEIAKSINGVDQQQEMESDSRPVELGLALESSHAILTQNPWKNSIIGGLADLSLGTVAASSHREAFTEKRLEVESEYESLDKATTVDIVRSESKKDPQEDVNWPEEENISRTSSQFSNEFGVVHDPRLPIEKTSDVTDTDSAADCLGLSVNFGIDCTKSNAIIVDEYGGNVDNDRLSQCECLADPVRSSVSGSETLPQRDDDFEAFDHSGPSDSHVHETAELNVPLSSDTVTTLGKKRGFNNAGITKLNKNPFRDPLKRAGLDVVRGNMNEQKLSGYY